MVSLGRTTRGGFEKGRASSLIRYSIFQFAHTDGYRANKVVG